MTDHVDISAAVGQYSMWEYPTYNLLIVYKFEFLVSAMGGIFNPKFG